MVRFGGYATVGAAVSLVVSCASGGGHVIDIGRLEPCSADGLPTTIGPDDAMLTLAGSRSREARVRAVDGRPFKPQWCDIGRLVLDPGPHRILVSYLLSYSASGPSGREIVPFEFEAAPAGRYAVDIERDSWSWEYTCSVVGVEDSRDVVRIPDCRARWADAAWAEVLAVWRGLDGLSRQYERLLEPTSDSSSLSPHR